MLKSGTPYGLFSILSKLITKNKTMRIIQTKVAIEKFFETFLPTFLKIPVRKFTFSKVAKVRNNV